MKLYVGNLAYSTTDDGLRATFETCGAVDSASVVMDRQTGRSKGFGFVEMSNRQEAEQAIAELNDTSLDGRSICVNEARPREDNRGGRPQRGGYGRY